MTRKCRTCRQPFKPEYNTLQPTCGNIQCAITYGKEQQRKAEKRKNQQAKREFRENDLSWWLSVTDKESSTNGGNTAYWLHKWIRLVRDLDQPCIMCGSQTPKGGQWHACHYRSRGAAKHLRFEPDNIHKGCAQCNTRTTGDTAANYRKNLVDRIGEERVTALETNNQTHKWTIEECRAIRDHYRDLCKRAEVR